MLTQNAVCCHHRSFLSKSIHPACERNNNKLFYTVNSCTDYHTSALCCCCSLNSVVRRASTVPLPHPVHSQCGSAHAHHTSLHICKPSFLTLPGSTLTPPTSQMALFCFGPPRQSEHPLIFTLKPGLPSTAQIFVFIFMPNRHKLHMKTYKRGKKEKGDVLEAGLELICPPSQRSYCAMFVECAAVYRFQCLPSHLSTPQVNFVMPVTPEQQWFTSHLCIVKAVIVNNRLVNEHLLHQHTQNLLLW